MFDPELVDLFFENFDEIMKVHEMYSQKEIVNPEAFDPVR